jgi:alpha-N-arabinofuranosidase
MLQKGPNALNSIWGLSLHYYSWNISRGRTQNWVEGKGDAVNFQPVEWYELMKEAAKLETLIEGHWQVMNEFDAKRRIKLVVDEWGPWYKPGSEVAPTHILGQMITQRDAVMSGLTLDIFNRHPDKVTMANCAQLINCLNSLYLAHEDKFCVTPVGHVFALYAAHQGGQSLRTTFSAPAVHYDRDGKPAAFWGLQGSASLHGKELVLTVVNPHVSVPRETAVTVRGATVVSGSTITLTSADIHARNTFAEPTALEPQSKSLVLGGPPLTVIFPPASVTRLSLTLS